MGQLAEDMLELLSQPFADRPIAAIEVAEAIGASPNGNRERKRRTVRALAEELRRTGHRICACDDGYWLARDGMEWSEYLAARKSGARYEFVAERQMAEAVRDRLSGQGRLFEATV